MSTLQPEQAKEHLLKVFTVPQSVLVSYYRVKVTTTSLTLSVLVAIL